MSKPNIFHKDNLFTKVMYKAGSLVLLNIYFILCSIPIVTIGASLTAANTVCIKIREETDVKVTGTFFRSFASNFMNATLVWICLAGIISMCVCGMMYGFTTKAASSYLICAVSAVVGMIMLMVLTYYFILLARFENDIMSHIKNSFIIAGTHFVRTALIWLVWLVTIGIFIVESEILAYMGWIWLAIGFALLIYMTNSIFKAIVCKIKIKTVNEEE